jgi:hypothetical protein
MNTGKLASAKVGGRRLILRESWKIYFPGVAISHELGTQSPARWGRDRALGCCSLGGEQSRK